MQDATVLQDRALSQNGMCVVQVNCEAKATQGGGRTERTLSRPSALPAKTWRARRIFDFAGMPFKACQALLRFALAWSSIAVGALLFTPRLSLGFGVFGRCACCFDRQVLVGQGVALSYYFAPWQTASMADANLKISDSGRCCHGHRTGSWLASVDTAVANLGCALLAHGKQVLRRRQELHFSIICLQFACCRGRAPYIGDRFRVSFCAGSTAEGMDTLCAKTRRQSVAHHRKPACPKRES